MNIKSMSVAFVEQCGATTVCQVDLPVSNDHWERFPDALLWRGRYWAYHSIRKRGTELVYNEPTIHVVPE